MNILKLTEYKWRYELGMDKTDGCSYKWICI